MKARTGLAALLASALMLAGCYDFEAPIDPAPTRPLDPALLGTWRCLAPGPKADETPTTLVFAGADREDVYSLVSTEGGKTRSGFEAHGSEVVGHTLLNVFDPNASSHPWMFIRYSFLMSNVLRLEVVDDDSLADV